MNKTIVTPPEMPCVCGSGKQLGNCHLVNNSINMPPSIVIPKPPITKLANAKCLFSEFKDCDKQISGDHIISAAVLRGLTEDRISIHGTDYSRVVAIDSGSLKTKKYCRRHNSALSPLDKEAGRLLRAYQAIDKSLTTAEDNPQKVHLFNGNDIERWLLKTLLSSFHGKISNINRHTHYLNKNLIRLFYTLDWPVPLGMYIRFKGHTDEPLAMPFELNIEISLVTSGQQVVGLNLIIMGIHFLLIVGDNPIEARNYANNFEYRPSFLNFFSGDVVRTIGFLWHNHTGKNLEVSRGDPNAKMPDKAIL
ncbi:MAG: hypothetical protein HP491_05835 [Nitrospira sp.]|nr:hypothetical protein [Nitrospira sp.]